MDTDHDEVETLKKWWRENGKVTVVGVVVGLGSVIGWNGWRSYEQAQSELVSVKYSQVVNAASAGNHTEAIGQTRQIVEEHPDSGYAALAALVSARSAFASGDVEEAKRNLRWAIAHGKSDELENVARIRLARLLLAEGEASTAETVLAEIEGDTFTAAASELVGDAALARADRGAAATAYRTALGAPDLQPTTRSRVQMKLDDLGLPAS